MKTFVKATALCVATCSVLAMSAMAGVIHLREGVIETASAPSVVSAATFRRMHPEASAEGIDQFLFHFAAHPSAGERKRAETLLGTAFSAYLPDNTFVAYVDVESAVAVGEALGVWVGRLAPEFKGASLIKDSDRVLLVQLYPGAKADGLAARLASTWAVQHGVRIDASSPEVLRVTLDDAMDPVALARNLAEHPQVHWIEKKPEYVFLNRHAREVCLSGQPQEFLRGGLDGTGQIIGVADSGLDRSSCFFSDPERDMPFFPNVDMDHRKVVSYIEMPGADDVDEVDGHGTHVCGSAAGAAPDDDDPASHYRAAASGAKIVFQDVGNARGLLLGIPDDLYSNFYTRAYNLGARIHTNSWGNPCSNFFGRCQTDSSGECAANTYTMDASNTDRFAWENKDMLILFAAGNDGDGPCSPQDSTFNTVSSPSTAKNILTVGASSSSADGWMDYCSRTFGETGDSFDECLDDHPETEEWMSFFSSRGPTRDRRIKPDVSAPGYGIYSARSVGGQNLRPTCEILFMMGTSMATPFTAGLVAIVRQYFMDGFHPAVGGFTPSAALLKAVLAATAVEMSGNVDVRNNFRQLDQTPSNFHGFGLVRLPPTMTPAGDTTQDNRRIWINTVCGSDPSFLAAESGSSHTYQIDVVDPSQPVQFTLVWTDYPSQATSQLSLVNNLDLSVQSPAPGAALRYGNDVYNERYNLEIPDIRNNVEEISFLAPVAGTYTVTVTATAINQGDEQPYSLVVVGGIDVIDAPSVVDIGSGLGNSVASGSLDESSPSGGALEASCIPAGSPEAWYSWTAPEANSYTFDLSGSTIGGSIAVFSSDNSVPDTCTGDELACGATSATTFVDAGETVRIVVAGANSGDFILNIWIRSCASLPVTNAGFVLGPNVITGSLSASTQQGLAFSCGDVSDSSPQTHYIWTAPDNGYYTFGLSDPTPTNAFQPVIAVFEADSTDLGSCVGAQLGCSQSAVGGLWVYAGSRVRIVISSMDGLLGDFAVSILQRDTCAPPSEGTVLLDAGSSIGDLCDLGLEDDDNDDDEDDNAENAERFGRPHWVDWTVPYDSFYTITVDDPLATISVYSTPADLFEGELCVADLIASGVGSISDIQGTRGQRLRIAFAGRPDCLRVYLTCSQAVTGANFVGSQVTTGIPVGPTPASFYPTTCATSGASSSAVQYWIAPEDGYYSFYVPSGAASIAVLPLQGDPAAQCQVPDSPCAGPNDAIRDLWLDEGDQAMVVITPVDSTSASRKGAAITLLYDVYRFCTQGGPADVFASSHTGDNIASATTSINPASTYACGDDVDTSLSAKFSAAWQAPQDGFYTFSLSGSSDLALTATTPSQDCDTDEPNVEGQIACSGDDGATATGWMNGWSQSRIAGFGDASTDEAVPISLSIGKICAPITHELGSSVGSSVLVSVPDWIPGFQLASFMSCAADDENWPYLSVASWSSPRAGSFAITVEAGFMPWISVLTASTCQEQSCTGGPATVIDASAAGQEFYIAVSGGSGSFSLSISDICVVVDFDIGTNVGERILEGNTQDFPAGRLQPGCGGSSGNGPQAIIQWTAPETGTYTFSTQGSDYDTVIALFDTVDCAAQVCNDDISNRNLQSRVEATVQAGDTILIAVAGYSGAAGPFVLSIMNNADVTTRPTPTEQPPSPCSIADFDAGSATGSNVLSGSTRNARSEIVAFSCGGSAAEGKTAIVRWMAPFDGEFSFSLGGSDFDTVLALLVPDTCDEQSDSCNDDGGPGLTSLLRRSYSQGQEVVMAIGGYNGRSGTFTLSVFAAESPESPGPSPLPACRTPDLDIGSQVGNRVLEASTQGAREGIIRFGCGGLSSNGPTALIAWQAPEDGTFSFSTAGSSFDTVLALVLPGPCSVIACNDDIGFLQLTSRIGLVVDQGAEIMIAVGGYDGVAGDFVLNINRVGEPTLEVDIDSCGGQTTFTLSGYPAGTSVAIGASRNQGSFALQTGTCAGTVTGLQASSLLGSRIITTNSNGAASFSVTGFNLCGTYAQAVDLVNCSVSDLQEL